MSNDVFANGREIACKSGSGKVIAALPDVCFTPPDKVPPTPPGVPIPYPLTSMASDSDKGTKKVLISNKEVMKRDSSNFKKCMGDEAAQTAKKGMISSKLTGKVFFTSWSMDVKIEGKNVVRHLDTTTSNHSSPNANAACPWPQIDTVAPPDLTPKPCKKECRQKPVEEEDKEKLRKKTPSTAVRRAVNNKQKKCVVCKLTASQSPPPGKYKNLAADHIVPKAIIERMPGFACLSFDDQKDVLNTPENYVGMCVSCNSSKNDKLWFKWKRHKTRDIDLTSNIFKETRKTAQEKTHASIKNLKNKIKSMKCK